jgi:hypothetical protein
MTRPTRVTKKPDRFADVQLSMNKGAYHGRKDTYQRTHIKRETLINSNSTYSDRKSYCGYKKDGFVVSDSELHLLQSSSHEVAEDEIKTDDEDEEDDYDENVEESEGEESEEEESDDEKEKKPDDKKRKRIN